MLELASGVFTGSIYYDMGLYSIGELMSTSITVVTDRSAHSSSYDMGLNIECC